MGTPTEIISFDKVGRSFAQKNGELVATRDIVAFATVHVPLVNPVFAAKSCVTADHVGRGRFGLNVVSGWNVEEFEMFGAQLLEHDDRYGYTEEWVSVVKGIWSQENPFDYNGRRWVFSHTHPERDAMSGTEIDWLVFTEHLS